MIQGVTARYAAWLKEHLAKTPDLNDARQLNLLLRRLGQWRSRMIANTYTERHGLVIMSGPFQGMLYTERQTEGALTPRLFGSYEDELHPHLQRLAQAGLDCVIDIGCAEGYYAVGLARLMPQVTVYAHDIDPSARQECTLLAAKNGVSDRVMVGGEFRPEDFEAFAGRKCLVMVDAEGAEDDILVPERAPALAGMHVIVETHDLYRPGVMQRLLDRFSPTHEIERVDHGPKTTPLPDWVMDLSHMDRLIAVWEFRAGPTPWLVMTPKG
ncbi:MAG TPA: hypothetical protein VIO94_16840 [Phenylobacterium sp.]